MVLTFGWMMSRPRIAQISPVYHRFGSGATFKSSPPGCIAETMDAATDLRSVPVEKNGKVFAPAETA